MKKYVKPTITGELFVSNEYIGACTILESGEGDIYYFVCDAGGGEYGGLYDEDWDRISSSWNSYHACGKAHESPIDANVYIKGWFDPDKDHDNGNEEEIYIWLEKNKYGQTVNRHGTRNLDKDTWNKNFS